MFHHSDISWLPYIGIVVGCKIIVVLKSKSVHVLGWMWGTYSPIFVEMVLDVFEGMALEIVYHLSQKETACLNTLRLSKVMWEAVLAMVITMIIGNMGKSNPSRKHSSDDMVHNMLCSCCRCRVCDKLYFQVGLSDSASQNIICIYLHVIRVAFVQTVLSFGIVFTFLITICLRVGINVLRNFTWKSHEWHDFEAGIEILTTIQRAALDTGDFIGTQCDFWFLFPYLMAQHLPHPVLVALEMAFESSPKSQTCLEMWDEHKSWKKKKSNGPLATWT